MSSTIKVSVIIPVYNTEKYLRECLDSVVQQTLEEIEIICVNDGSPDNSREILKAYAESDERIRVIEQNNAGLSAARNTGLAAAKGAFIYFLDSDDRIDPHALEILYGEASLKNLDILYFNGSTFYDDKKLEHQNQKFKNRYERNFELQDILTGKQLYKRMQSAHAYNPSVAIQFFSKAFLLRNELSFFEGILHEDNLFSFACILKAERVSCIQEVLFRRRMRADSIMTQPFGAENLRGYFISFIEMLKLAIHVTHDNEFEETITNHLRLIYERTLEIFKDIPQNEKELFLTKLNESERFIFESFFRSYLFRSIINKELKRKESELKKVKESKVYRVGQTITWLPKFIRGLLQRGIKRKK